MPRHTSSRRHRQFSAAIEPLEPRQLFSAGDPDVTFNSDGESVFTPGGTFQVAAVDTRGSLTVVLGGTGTAGPGEATGGSNLLAFDPNGNLAASFSADGLRPLPRLTNPRDLFIGPDGKILVAGTVD